MRRVKLITTVVFCLLVSLVFGQNKKFNCTEDLQEDLWLIEKYDFFKYWIEEEAIEINKQSYWIFGSGEGETSISNSVLIIPMKQKTTIYQYSSKLFIDKQIVKEKISIEYLSNYFKKLNGDVESNVISNAKYFVLSLNNLGENKCEKIIYSVEFPPMKINDEYLIDFNKIIREMN
jgi:hypothetical protein